MKRFGVLLFILFAFYLSAQTLMNRDSLLQRLPAAKEDTNKVLLLINIGQQYEGNEPETAKQYYKQARALSKKLNYVEGELKFVTNYGYVLNMQGHFDSALELNLQSVALAKSINSREFIAKTLFNTGSSYRLKEDYQTAAAYYLEAYPMIEKSGNRQMLAQAMDILQNLYTGMHQYRKGVEYGYKAVRIFRQTNDSIMLGTALNNLGINYNNLQIADSARNCFAEALSISRQIGDLNMEATQYLNMGDVLVGEGMYSELKPFMEKALALSRQLEIFESEAIALKGISYYYHDVGNYPMAKVYADSALQITIRYNLRDQRQKIYSHFSNLAYSMQNKKLGDEYGRKATMLDDSILNEAIQKTVVDIEKKYETEKKDNQIKLQQASLRQKNTLNYILIGSAAALLLISLLGYRNYLHKQKLQQQRITELETEKQLTATEAVLKGEEQERARLAKDLHDGLGGMLSGIKYSFQNMKGNLVMTPDNAQAFERSIDMLDSSIKEMRRVAHNMMPEALVKFGLDTALKDFCNDINQSGALKVNYQSIGMDKATIEQTTAITIYRIVQELLNNTMKHAAAKNAIVQLSKADAIISVTVEDDGNGFDTGVLQQSKGIGWDNIQNRVEFLKGKLDVHSQLGKGTSVLIELNI